MDYRDDSSWLRWVTSNQPHRSMVFFLPSHHFASTHPRSADLAMVCLWSHYPFSNHTTLWPSKHQLIISPVVTITTATPFLALRSLHRRIPPSVASRDLPVDRCRWDPSAHRLGRPGAASETAWYTGLVHEWWCPSTNPSWSLLIPKLPPRVYGLWVCPEMMGILLWPLFPEWSNHIQRPDFGSWGQMMYPIVGGFPYLKWSFEDG